MPTFKVSEVDSLEKFRELYTNDRKWIDLLIKEVLRADLSDDEITEVVDKIYAFIDALSPYSKDLYPLGKAPELHHMNNDTTRKRKRDYCVQRDAKGRFCKPRITAFTGSTSEDRPGGYTKVRFPDVLSNTPFGS